MERQEIEAELNEVERDLADIARRAHIAASNLRSVADAGNGNECSAHFRSIADGVERFTANATIARLAIAKTREIPWDAKPAPVAAEEGGAE